MASFAIFDDAPPATISHSGEVRSRLGSHHVTINSALKATMHGDIALELLRCCPPATSRR